MKFNVMKRERDKRVIHQRTLDIANQLMPNNIGGIATCPEGHYLKIIFNTGLAILYEFVEPDIKFIMFYYDVN